MYDFLIVGAGIYGATIAHQLKKAGKKVLVIDKRDHVGGNIYTKEIEGINVHMYGAHIFHTSNEEVWNFLNQFTTFNDFINSPLANYKGEIYHLPFNMYTFKEIWNDIKTVEDAKKHIEEEKEKYYVSTPKNLQEQAINLVGKTIYDKLIKEYTEKQWGRECSLLPPEIIKRLPVRFTFDNNYFSDKYQGIPKNGYTKMIENMLDGIDVNLNVDFLKSKKQYFSIAKIIIFTGSIDSYFDYKFGALEYRSLEFKHKLLNTNNYQNNAVINFTSNDVPYTRIIEHKHFANNESEKTIITFEYPKEWKLGLEAYYPINDEKNTKLYEKYLTLAKKQTNIIFAGRLGMYKYFDMDDAVESALNLASELIKKAT